MGRKKPQPQQLNECQREKTNWNMLDNGVRSTFSAAPSPGLVVVDDDDPSLALETIAAEKENIEQEIKADKYFKNYKEQVKHRSSAEHSSGYLDGNENGDMIPESLRQFFRSPELQKGLKQEWSFSVPLYSKKHSSWQNIEKSWHWEAGKICVQLKDHDGLALSPEVAAHLSSLKWCTLYFSETIENKVIIYFEVYDKLLEEQNRLKLAEEEKRNYEKGVKRPIKKKKLDVENRLGLYWFLDLDSQFLKINNLFQKLCRVGKKKFQLFFGDFSSTGRQLEITLYGLEESLQSVSFPSEGFVSKGINQCLKEVMDYFYDLGPLYNNCKLEKLPVIQQDFQEFFSAVKSLQQSQAEAPLTDVDVQHPHLKPKLRMYQQDAVRWMLQQEGFGEGHQHDHADDLHPLYTEVSTRCNKILYYSRQGGRLVLEKPKISARQPGGILADEMGLGKTVEVLCCMLLHPRPPLPSPPRLPTLTEIESRSDMNSQVPSTFYSEVASAECSPSRKPFLCTTEESMKDEREQNLVVGQKRKSSASSDEERERAIPRKVERLLNERLQILPKKSVFECVCGKGATPEKPRKSRKAQHVVTCNECGSSQHAECMHYNLEDPFRGPYKCPHCHYKAEPIPSGATLIITPSSIAHQWCDEIKKHIWEWEQSIKVFVYTGVRNQGYIQPQTLACQDIVIASYETLRKELDFVDIPHTMSDTVKKLRNPKKFMTMSTPLTAVQWWRVCLDEAQMVEGVVTKSAEMAMRLCCINRWCVTGTPLNNSINDLFGLLAFLAYDPFFVEWWWKELLYHPYLQGIKGPLLNVVSQVMWRNSMEEVKDQLNLPNKTEEAVFLDFSLLENIFYRQIYNKCVEEISKSTLCFSEEQKSTKLKELDRETLTKILRPLRKLRQACCHPQAVRGSFISVQQSILSMEELLENLIKKAVLECIESHRAMILSMNARAGIMLIEDQPRVAEAVSIYRAVLNSVAENEKLHNLKTDRLQQIHALHNLQEVLRTNPAGIGRTLRDDQIPSQLQELKEKFMERSAVAVIQCQEALFPLQQSVQQLTQQLESNETWYLDILNHACKGGVGKDLVQKVFEDVSEVIHDAARNYYDVAGLQYVIMTHLEELESCYEKMRKAMKMLADTEFNDEVSLQVLVNCCLRLDLNSPHDEEVPKNCIFCKVDADVQLFESKLCHISVFQKTKGGKSYTYREGNWHPSVLECILKSLLSYARNHRLSDDIIHHGTVHINLFEALKKEYRQSRTLWLKLREQVSLKDEMRMAVTRMRLRLPFEQKVEGYSAICEPTEIESLRRTFESQEKVYSFELKTKLGQLEYLRSLAKGSQREFKDGINPEECPICKGRLGKNWCVFKCGHCCCMDCVQLLINNSKLAKVTKEGVSIKCMICRKITKSEEVSYVSTSRPTDSCKVKGSHSTKIKAVVQRVFDILKEEPAAKILVFATWVDVLMLISKALEDNQIQFTCLSNNSQQCQKNLTLFKENKEITVLLLPYQSGSKGLNICEANHIILVEPVLSPSQENQAIGRIYRMGQTRPTKIHRLLINRTIEHRIHRLMENTLRVAADCTDTDVNLMTVGQLISLFDNDKHDEDDDNYSDSEEDEDSARLQKSPQACDPSAEPQPSCSGTQPSCSGTQPSCSEPQPSCSGTQPSCSEPQPSCSGTQPSCSGTQPSCSGTQPSCSGTQPSCSEPQPSCSGTQPSCSEPQPSCSGTQPSCSEPQPSCSGTQLLMSISETPESSFSETPSSSTETLPHGEVEINTQNFQC